MASNKTTTAGRRAESPARHIRIGDEVWLSAVRKAESEGMSISELVRALLRAYNRGDITV